MSLPGFCVRRPVFTTMVTLVVVLLGLISLNRLRTDLLPNIELPVLTVRTAYEGASPEVMERLITQVVEEVVATVPGVEQITSNSSEGDSTVRVSFAWGTQIDTATLDVLGKLEDEINNLPEDVTRPTIRKFDVDAFPVVILGISSQLDPMKLTQLIEDQVRYRLSRIPGVAQVDIWGGFDREVRVELDPDRLKALGVPLDRVLGAIQDANLDLPAGQIERGRYELNLRAPAEFHDLDQIRQTVIHAQDGAQVHLGQIAQVRETYQRQTRLIRVEGHPGVRVGIRKQADANTVEVARLVMAEVEALNQAYPQIKIIPAANQGNFIQRSIANVASSVLYGGGLAVLVLLFFLRNVRSTLVISLAMPISVVATFSLLYFYGFTLNLMSLGGLALGVGMMVDNSIVVLENVFRRQRENGEAPATAAEAGANEVGAAILASTLTTLVIFLPLVFVRGVAGVLFKELAYVVVFSLLCSLVVAFCLVPMLAARLLKPPAQARRDRAAWAGRLADLSDRGFRGLDQGYRGLLSLALDHPWRTVGVAALLLAGSLALSPFIGSELLPPSDEGDLRVYGEMEIGTRLGLVDRQTKLMESLVYPAVPEAVSSVTVVGGSGRQADQASTGQIQLSLTPAAQRERSNTDIAAELRRRLTGRIPGMSIRARAPQGQFLLERLLGGNEGLTVEVRGYDLDTLDRLARRALTVVSGVKGITDARLTQQAGTPQTELSMDRAKIADLGLSVRQVSQAIKTAVAGANAGEFRSHGDSCRIWVQLAQAQERSLEEILDLTLTTPGGEQVALRNLLEPQDGTGPTLIQRKDQQRLVMVEANVAGRDLGSVAADVQAGLDGLPRPAGYSLGVAGTFQEQQKAFGELIISLGLALVLVYMVLACQYESLLSPLVVMFSVPVAAVGVLLILFLTHTTLNLQSFIGCIMLGGIVVNNAILLVDQADQLRGQGMSPREAVLEAGRRRLRPILMTTLTTILALVPLALGVGEGAEAQAPLARAVVGGLTGSTLITLVLIPAVYLLMRSGRRSA